MYSLNTMTTRYSNLTATTSALKVLENTNNPKLVSLIKARFFESEFSYNNYKTEYGLANYTTCTVSKNIHGYTLNKYDIPEEYQEFAIEMSNSSSTYWWSLFKNKISWLVNANVIVKDNCKIEDVSQYTNEKLECGLSVNYSTKYNISWDSVLEDILSGKLDLSNCPITSSYSYNQFSDGQFHPPPSMNDIITVGRKAELSKLCVLFNLEVPISLDILNVSNLISELEKKLFLQNPIYKVDIKRKHKNTVDKKDTLKAEYQLVATEQERLELPKSLRYIKSYMYYVKLIGLLRGRLQNMFLPAISASALIIDKTGLAMCGKPSKDPISNAFVSLLMGAFSYQKLFTIESQMHGGIDKWLKAYLDLLINEHVNTTDFTNIFKVIPSPRLVELVNKDELTHLYNYVISWLKLFSSVFESQWNLGVSTCVSRDMKVPRRGTTEINVNAWNACAGAWGNLTRYIKLIGQQLEKPHMQIFKVLKMTAGDQMKWADQAGKSVDQDCIIFKTLTLNLNIMPWDGLFKEKDNWIELIEKTCKDCNVEVKKWIGTPKERDAEIRADVVSVCGVIVAPEDVELIKETGAFGSHNFGISN